jgi:endonuclease/exonuclease/phosphatase family metal-dependent hydrolase
MKNLLIIFLSLSFYTQAQNFPKFGVDSLLEIAAWNTEWFGDSTNGPSDEIAQFNNIVKLIKTVDIDIWSLEEVSNQQTFMNMMNQLSSYSASISTFNQTQKMAILWKNNLFDKIKEEHILTSYYNDFAGRPPLMTTLRYKKGDLDTLYVISVHLKANTGTTSQKQDAYLKRKNAANFLKLYIEAVLKDKKYIVLGDWNDRLDYTIFDGTSASPFIGLIDANYFFASKTLADKGRKTYYTGSVIDHILVSDSLNKLYIDGSIDVFDNANVYLPGFSYSTSDHYPVFASYKFFNEKPTQTDTSLSSMIELKSNSFEMFPNPSSNNISIINQMNIPLSLSIFNLLGQEIIEETVLANGEKVINLSSLRNGMYIIKSQTKDGFLKIQRLVKGE